MVISVKKILKKFCYRRLIIKSKKKSIIANINTVVILEYQISYKVKRFTKYIIIKKAFISALILFFSWKKLQSK